MPDGRTGPSLDVSKTRELDLRCTGYGGGRTVCVLQEQATPLRNFGFMAFVRLHV